MSLPIYCIQKSVAYGAFYNRCYVNGKKKDPTKPVSRVFSLKNATRSLIEMIEDADLFALSAVAEVNVLHRSLNLAMPHVFFERHDVAT